ncbi:unnamed protein product, partial [Mesorhabditis belari]|uniref:Tetratricopeptide repeat protein 7 N-terminal domain-containing protein n=1 Tax=Mesorhabditis belari TaxID=2138241 RepID=A0AAF3E9B2_9BILA
MTSKLRGSRLEAEVDRARTESNWRRVTDLLSAVKSKHSGMDAMVEVLEAEALLEQEIERLDVFAPRAENSSSFSQSSSLLKEAILQRKNHPGVQLEAHLLLAKVLYLCSNYEDAIKTIEKSGMDSAITQFRTLRALRLVAEAYSIKGLSIEALDGTGSKKAITCFEQAAELVISYVGELEKSIFAVPTPLPSKGTPVSTTSTIPTLPTIKATEKMGEFLECSLERVANLRLKQLAIDGFFTEQGVEWYRRIISNLGDKSIGEKLQQRLSIQLAELLYRAIPDPSLHSEAVTQKSKSLGFYTGSQKGYYSPASKMEEIILLLLISEVLATREVVLSRTEELTISRHESLRNAKSVYNLITLLLSSLHQYQLLSNIYERAMKFANQDNYLWYQFGLCLICRGRWLRASRVLKECLDIEHKDEEVASEYLMASLLHIEHLGQFEQAVAYADRAALLAENKYLRVRANVLRSIGLSQMALCEATFEARRDGLQKSIDVLEKCIEADPHDYLALYYCALQHAIVRDLDSAKDRCLRSLEANAEQPSALMLLALLFTCEGDLKSALELVLTALKDFPENYGLLVLRLHLEKRFGRVEEALDTAAHLLQFWKKKEPFYVTTEYEEKSQQTVHGADAASLFREGSIARTGTVSLGRETTPLFTGPLGIPTPSLAISSQSSQLGLDMSDSGVLTAGAASDYGAQSTADSSDAFGTNSAFANRAYFRAQANIWTTLAELFLDEGRLNDVTPCVEQAIALFPNSHQALYLKGTLCLARAERAQADSQIHSKLLGDAKVFLLSAIAMSPSHTESLVQLAKLYRLERNYGMAEQVYRELVRLDPLWCDWWQALGEVLFASGNDMEKAAEALAMAASLDRSTPILSFTCIPLVFPSHFT